MQKRTIGVAIALATAAGVGPAFPANADPGEPQGFVEDELFYAFHYFDPDGDVVVTAGAPIEDFCLMADPGITELRVFPRRDGTDSLKAHGRRDQRIFVYDFAGDSMELIGATCEAIFDGDATTGPPEPVAEGSGTLKFTVDGIEGPDDVGGYQLSNSINGFATGPDGMRWKVRAWADLEIGEDGVPVGSPVDFQGADVRRIGP